jgi:Spy/CpxP family protein refolding chaperone
MPVVHADNTKDSTSERDNFHQQKQERMGKKIQEIYAKLNLTDAQKKQLEDNKSKNFGQMKGNFGKMRAVKEALKAELMKSDLDTPKINELQSQLKAMQAEMTDRRLNSLIEVREILTPEQFTKFTALMEERKRERGEDKE